MREHSTTDTERRGKWILVTIRELHRGEKVTITAWSEVRENLGLNQHGTERVSGVYLAYEEPYYVDPDDDYPFGYKEVVLAFYGTDALDAARERIREKADERFEDGTSDAGNVRDFAGNIPAGWSLNDRGQDTDIERGA